MVKLYISLLALTLSTSSALAFPATHFRIGIVTNSLSPRGDLLDTREMYNNLEARDLFEELGSSGNYDRRGLEDDEELLQRDFDVEELELWGREYDDFLVERDAFDDLD